MKVVRFSPDGRLFATGGADGLVALWDVTDPVHPALITMRASSDSVWAVAFTADSRTLITGENLGGLRIWDLTAWSAAADDPVGRACALVGTGRPHRSGRNSRPAPITAARAPPRM